MSSTQRVIIFAAAIASIFGVVLILVHEPIRTTASLIIVLVIALLFSVAAAIDLVRAWDKSRSRAETLINTLQRSIITQRQQVGAIHTNGRWDEVITTYPWELGHVDYFLEYLDVTGSRVAHKKTQLIIPRVDLHDIRDTNIRADGELDYDSFYSTPGEVVNDPDEIEKHKVGTMITIRTTLEPPQKAGHEFSREFGYVMKDSFLKEDETFGIHISHLVQEFTFQLKVPPPLHLSNVRSEIHLGAYVRETHSEPKLSEDNSRFSFAVLNPQLGERYILHWKVHGLVDK